MTDRIPVDERPLPEFIGHPPTLLDPQTARAVRALCWTLATILWLWLALGAATVLAFIVGIVNT